MAPVLCSGSDFKCIFSEKLKALFSGGLPKLLYELEFVN